MKEDKSIVFTAKSHIPVEFSIKSSPAGIRGVRRARRASDLMNLSCAWRMAVVMVLSSG